MCKGRNTQAMSQHGQAWICHDKALTIHKYSLHVRSPTLSLEQRPSIVPHSPDRMDLRGERQKACPCPHLCLKGKDPSPPSHSLGPDSQGCQNAKHKASAHSLTPCLHMGPAGRWPQPPLPTTCPLQRSPRPCPPPTPQPAPRPLAHRQVPATCLGCPCR